MFLGLKQQHGTVLSVKDGIVSVVGLQSSTSGELLLFENLYGFFVKGMVCTIEESTIDVVLFGDDRLIAEGTSVFRSGDLFKVPVGLQMFGRVVDALGRPQDEFSLNGRDSNSYESLWSKYPGFSAYIERRAPGILDRQPVNQPLQTGIRSIDCLIPIGRGQRELIIGDRQTGKSSLLFDILLNLKRENMVNEKVPFKGFSMEHLKGTIWAVYVAIGHRKGRIARLWSDILKYGLDRYICVVAAFASESAPLQFLAAYSGCAQGEYIRDIVQGDCVIFYNDLSKHAVAYRQMSLLLRRPSGREAYPGDVFYIHSRLLERAAKLSDELGGGSLTALPVIETQAGDITAYIPTNVISITDGQIFLESSLFYRGIRPAINIGLSVSRVGSAAQVTSLKKLAGSLKLTLAQFREVEVFSRLAVNLTNVTTMNLIKRGRVLTQMFIQKERDPLTVISQIIMLHAALSGQLDTIELNKVSTYVDGLNKFITHILHLDFLSERDAVTVNEICSDFVLMDLILELFNIYVHNFEEHGDSFYYNNFIK